MRLVLFFAAIFSAATLSAQNTKAKPDSMIGGSIKCGNDKMSEFPGGPNFFRNKIAQNFRMRKVRGIGKQHCDVIFIVERDGSISTIRAVGNNETFNAEAVHAVSKITQKWQPASICGQAVRSRFRVPLHIDFP